VSGYNGSPRDAGCPECDADVGMPCMTWRKYKVTVPSRNERPGKTLVSYCHRARYGAMQSRVDRLESYSEMGASGKAFLTKLLAEDRAALDRGGRISVRNAYIRRIAYLQICLEWWEEHEQARRTAARVRDQGLY
jgi:hypothetical protein